MNWMLLCLGTWALWVLQTIVMAFWFLPRFAEGSRRIGESQGRYDAEHGYPRRQVRP